MMVIECLTHNFNNSKPCNGTFEECAKPRICESEHACFVLWQVGSPNLTSGGCHQFVNECDSKDCIGQQRGPRYYCCCNENLCNRNYKLPPPSQVLISERTPTEIQQISPPTNILWSLIPIVLIVTLIGSFIYRYRKSYNNSAVRNQEGQSNGTELNDFRANNDGNVTRAPFQNSFPNCLWNKFRGHSDNANIRNQNMATITSNNNNHLVDNDHAVTQSLINHHHHPQFRRNSSNHYHNHYEGSKSHYEKVDLNRVKLLEVIGSGRFGTVHRATLDDSTIVAVKIILCQDHESWSNELKIYFRSSKHKNILNFYFSDEHHETNSFWLVIDYASRGCLNSFLEKNTISWNEILTIAVGIGHGLSHLHEVHVVHRDFKSKNVLLKHDLTPCITDFGVSAVLDCPGGNQLDQRKTFLQVGTPRYMAPEVLECSVTFTKASFFKIDVYALSLVLWELISRCRCPMHHRSLSSSPTHRENVFNSSRHPYFGDFDGDYYRKHQIRLDATLPSDRRSLIPKEFYDPPPYELPFQDAAGINPDIDRMRQIVVVEKRRPPIMEAWHDYPAAEFCRAIEDGWEYDCDARISASCIVERLEILLQNSFIAEAAVTEETK